MAEETTRQEIARLLRDRAMTASALADAVGSTPDTVLEHVRHVARSLGPADDELLVEPPSCRDCGFDGFDDPANRPSKCPRCRSESMDEPRFTIR